MIEPRPGKILLNHEREKVPLQVVGDAGIATPGVGDGRMIPLIILDTSARPDLEEYIRLHQFIPTGDVNCRWAQLPSRSNSVALVLRFIKPAELVAIIEFDLESNQGILVEQIIGTRGLYIQAGRPGDRLKHDVDKPKIILEIPDTGWRPIWEKLYEKYVLQRMRQRGLARPEAKRAAKSFLEKTRRLVALRMKAKPPSTD